MKQKLIDAGLVAASLAVGFVLIELMLIGAIFLIMPHHPENTGTCDTVKQYGGQWECVVYIKGPGEQITVVRGGLEP